MRKATERRGKKIAPIVVAVLVILYLIPVLVFILRSVGVVWAEVKAAAVLLIGYLFLGGAVIRGVIKALLERLREIDGGEEEDASQY